MCRDGRRKSTQPRLVSLGRTGTGRCFIEIDVKSLSFAVVGAGRLGSGLALALRAQGPSLVGYSARTPEGRARADAWLGGSASADLDHIVSLHPDLYLLAVPDSALPEIASGLASLLSPDTAPLVAHTSGATSVRVLAPCAEAGATTFAFHPLQTFPDPLSAIARFSGAAVAVTPTVIDDHSRGVKTGFALARLLGARPFLLADKDRVLYHAAATVACNYFVTLQHLAEDMFIRSGLPAEEALSMFFPLVRATLENIQSQGTTQALTGPLSRGDTDTIRRHLAAIARDAKDVDPVYRALGLATLALVRDRKDVPADTIQEMVGLLTSSLGTLTENPDPQIGLTDPKSDTLT